MAPLITLDKVRHHRERKQAPPKIDEKTWASHKDEILALKANGRTFEQIAVCISNDAEHFRPSKDQVRYVFQKWSQDSHLAESSLNADDHRVSALTRGKAKLGPDKTLDFAVLSDSALPHPMEYPAEDESQNHSHELALSLSGTIRSNLTVDSIAIASKVEQLQDTTAALSDELVCLHTTKRSGLVEITNPLTDSKTNLSHMDPKRRLSGPTYLNSDSRKRPHLEPQISDENDADPVEHAKTFTSRLPNYLMEWPESWRDDSSRTLTGTTKSIMLMSPHHFAMHFCTDNSVLLNKVKALWQRKIGPKHFLPPISFDPLPLDRMAILESANLEHVVMFPPEAARRLHASADILAASSQSSDSFNFLLVIYCAELFYPLTEYQLLFKCLRVATTPTQKSMAIQMALNHLATPSNELRPSTPAQTLGHIRRQRSLLAAIALAFVAFQQDKSVQRDMRDIISQLDLSSNLISESNDDIGYGLEATSLTEILVRVQAFDLISTTRISRWEFCVLETWTKSAFLRRFTRCIPQLWPNPVTHDLIAYESKSVKFNYDALHEKVCHDSLIAMFLHIRSHLGLVYARQPPFLYKDMMVLRNAPMGVFDSDHISLLWLILKNRHDPMQTRCSRQIARDIGMLPEEILAILVDYINSARSDLELPGRLLLDDPQITPERGMLTKLIYCIDLLIDRPYYRHVDGLWSSILRVFSQFPSQLKGDDADFLQRFEDHLSEFINDYDPVEILDSLEKPEETDILQTLPLFVGEPMGASTAGLDSLVFTRTPSVTSSTPSSLRQWIKYSRGLKNSATRRIDSDLSKLSSGFSTMSLSSYSTDLLGPLSTSSKIGTSSAASFVS